MYMKRDQIFLLVLIAFMLVECKKSLHVPPPADQLIGSTVFENEGTALAAMVGIYHRMVQDNGLASGSFGSISYIGGLTSDELSIHSGMLEQQFYRNEILSDNSTMSGHLWNKAYQYIYSSNAIIEGIMKSEKLTAEAKNQLDGEARFLRSFLHFYLVNLWGDVPVVATTDYRKNSDATRAPESDVYKFIENDLLEAISQLPNNYVSGVSDLSEERIRPSAYSARALLARIYLYLSRWEEAAENASEVINQEAIYHLSELPGVFLKNNKEAIWQLSSPGNVINAPDAQIYIIEEGNVPSSGTINPFLLNSFEEGDQRRIWWIDSVVSGGVTYFFPFKYKVFSDPDTKEYTTIMRLAEQYLIRAEARAHLGNLSGAIDDVNVIRNRAGLPSLPGTLDLDQILKAVMQERRVELFTEWGHRWFDLKRTGQIDSVMLAEKPDTWQATDALFPLPMTETLINPRLTQNPGY